MIIVANRELIIPKKEQYIGTTYDKNSEYRQFLLDRVTAGGVDLANLLFTLDMEYMDGNFNSVTLSKEILDDKIILTWPLLESELQITGTTFINIRALNNTDGKVKWASFRAPVYIEDTIFTPGHYTGDLTELEQMEAAFQLDMERNADLYDMIKAAYDNHEFDGNGIADITLNDDYTLTITMDDGTVYNTISIRGPQGVSGVFVGPAPLPEGYNVWVDTEGETPAPQDGGYYIPSVTSKGVLKWTKSDPNMPTVASRNIKGMRGDSFLWRGDYDATKIYLPMDVAKYSGSSWLCLKECHEIAPVDGEYWAEIAEKGDAGAPRTFSIGTVQTLDAGQDAWVRLTGTEQNPVLNFGLPGGSVSMEDLYNLYPTDTVTEASFPDGARYIPIKNLVVDIHPVQSGSGDASPTNERPLQPVNHWDIMVSGTDNGQIVATSYEVYFVGSDVVYAGTWYPFDGLAEKGIRNVYHGASSEAWTATDDGGFKISVSDAEESNETHEDGSISINIKRKAYSNLGTYHDGGTAVGTIYILNKYLYYYPATTVTTVADFKTWLAGLTNGLQVAYKANSPVNVTISGMDEIPTYYGHNRVSSSAGDVTVTYRADLALFIKKQPAVCG